MKAHYMALLLILITLITPCISHASNPQAVVIDFRLEYGDIHFVSYKGNIEEREDCWYMNSNGYTAEIVFRVTEKEGYDAVLVFTYSKDDPDSVGRDTFELYASSGREYYKIWSAPEWGAVTNDTVYVYVPPEYKYFRFILEDGRNNYEYLILNKSMRVMIFTQNETPTTPIPPTPSVTPPPLIPFEITLSQEFFTILTLAAVVITSFIVYKIIKRGEERKRGKGVRFERYG